MKLLTAIHDWWRCHLSVRWGLVFLPVFALAVWFGTEALMAGAVGLDEVKASLVGAGVYSVRVFAAMFFVHLVTHPRTWGWDLDNDYRRELQEVMLGRVEGNQLGAFLILAGETFAKLALLIWILKALVLWPQGIA